MPTCAFVSAAQAVPNAKGGFILASPQQPLPFKGIRKSKVCRIFVRRKYLAFCLDKAGEVGLGQWGPEFPAHEAMAKLETANMTHGIQPIHLTTGPWKQYWNLTENNESSHSDYWPLPVSKGERADEFTSPGNFVLCLIPSVLCQKRIQCWSSAIYNTCHFVFGRAEVT